MGSHDSTGILVEMADLDLKEELNKQLVKLVSDEDIENIDTEIEFEVFQLAKKLKRKKVTKSSDKPAKKSKLVVTEFEKQPSETKVKVCERR